VFLDVSNLLEVMMLAVGVMWVLKKVAEMERYHELRVGVLTTLFSLVMLFSWMAMTNDGEDRWGVIRKTILHSAMDVHFDFCLIHDCVPRAQLDIAEPQHQRIK
jgi:hypothetical protein